MYKILIELNSMLPDLLIKTKVIFIIRKQKQNEGHKTRLNKPQLLKKSNVKLVFVQNIYSTSRAYFRL